MPSMNEVLAVILGGGQGKRLYPLTIMRSKPAVPIAGKYRLIDIPISNCINSGIYRMAILTQFNSVSLHRHITSTYNFDRFHSGYVQIWAAEQTMEYTDWYQGTADAVRKQLLEIQAARAKYVLILAGDHLYRMNYAAMAEFHWDMKADITVAVQPVKREEASALGILKRDPDFRITDFAEKPKDPKVLKTLVSRDDPLQPYLGSMGIYMFNTDFLIDLLTMRKTGQEFDDFGGDILPYAIKSGNVYGYDFTGYWRDIGTVRAFYETNLALTEPNPPFDLYDQDKPIYTHARFLPGARVEECQCKNVVIADGCVIQKSIIEHSIIGLRSYIRAGSKVTNSVIMGADFYDDNSEKPMGIGENCDIDGAIIDKNVRMGDGVVIRPFPRDTDLETDHYVVRDGVVVVPKRTILPAGTYIGPER